MPRLIDTSKCDSPSPEILLIQPPVYDFAAFDLFVYPLGLVHLSEVLARRGYRVELIDALDRFVEVPSSFGLKNPTFRKDGCGHFHRKRVDPPAQLTEIPRRFHRFGLPVEMIKSRLARKARPAAVAVSCAMTYWYMGVSEVIETVRSIWPDVPVLLGGTYAVLCADHARAHLDVDWIQTGRNPASLLAFLKEIAPSPAIRSAEKPAPFFGHDLVGPRESAAVQTSTGCPRRCPYCASHRMDGSYKARPINDVADEIEYLVLRCKRKRIAFYDDALLHNPEEPFVLLLEKIRRRGLHERATFHCPNALGASSITEDVAWAMKETNFRMIRIGFETADHILQQSLGDKASNEHLKEALEHLKAAEFQTQDIGVYLLAGLPNQTRESVEMSLQFVHEAGGLSRLAEYSPVPGTLMFEEARKISNLDLDEPLNHNKTLAPFRFDHFTLDDVRQLKAMVQKLNARLGLQQP